MYSFRALGMRLSGAIPDLKHASKVRGELGTTDPFSVSKVRILKISPDMAM